MRDTHHERLNMADEVERILGSGQSNIHPLTVSHKPAISHNTIKHFTWWVDLFLNHLSNDPIYNMVTMRNIHLLIL